MTFRSDKVLLFLGLVVSVCLMTTCGGAPIPPSTEEIREDSTISPTATVTAIPATATPIPPTQTPSPTPTPAPSFTKDGLQYTNLGNPEGDGYSPVALAVDEELGFIYVYNSYNSEDGQDTLSAIQADSLQVTNMVRLGGSQTMPSLSSQLLADDVRHRLYALNGDSQALLILDGQTLDITFIIHGAIRVALAPEQDRVYLINRIGQIKLLSASDYHSIASLDWEESFEASFMAYNPVNDSLYLAKWDFTHPGSVIVLDGTTLVKRTEIPLPSSPHALQVDTENNRIYVATDTGVTVIDGATDSVLKNLNLQIDSFNPRRSLTLNPTKDRLYLSYNWGLALSDGGGLVILDTESYSIVERVRTKHFWRELQFLPEEDKLYALPIKNEALLIADEAGKVQQRAMLGIRLLDMQTDPLTNRLWVIDSAGALHVLTQPPQLEARQKRENIIGVMDGAVESADLVVTKYGAYLTDTGRRTTISIDNQSLDVRLSFPAAGPLATDTQGQRLFVVDQNVKVFGLGTGKQVNEIPLPAGDEAPLTVEIEYEPVNDRFYLKMRSGINSSINYRTVWRAYNGTTGKFITTFNPDKRDIQGMAIVPEASQLYLAYAGASDWDRGLKTYDLGSVELDHIKGLYGQLTGSQDGQYLYVLRQSGVWALERETLNLAALWPLSEPYEQMVIDHENQWIYLRRDSQIAALAVKDLLEKGIQSPDRLPETIGLPASTYRSPQYETDETIYAIVPNEGVYRSEDRGETWILRNQGLKDLYVTELAFSGAFAEDGLLWAKTASQATYRSVDRGETWQRVSAWSPAIAFVSVRDVVSGIYIMNTDGSQVRALTPKDINSQHPSWDPENKWVCFDSNHEGSSEIYVIQADGYGLARLTDEQADDTQPDWSPVSEQIAFVSTRDGNPEIYLMNIDGANLTRLTDHPANDREPDWSPDGTRLVFTSDREGQDDLYLLNLENMEIARLTTSESRDIQPAWSPDGQWIAFVSDQHGDPDIFRIRPDGTELIQVTQASAAEQYPTWSPDSSALVFASDRTGTFQLYQMNSYGGDWRRLTTDNYANITPAWIN